MFSIGKMAEYCHTSIQTLRYYADIGLLKPSYQDPQSKYRYYKLDQIFQFTIIKYLQSTNLSLQQIKSIMNNADPDMLNFWKEQEANIKQRIAEEKKALSLAQFQQKQFQKLQILKSNLNKDYYIRKINTEIVEEPVNSILTPANIPDDVVSKLDQTILANGSLPNLEYCFTFKANRFKKLDDIHYLSMFKEVNESIPASHRITGKFLCVSFMWDRSKYLHYLDMLLSAAKNRFNIINPIVIEDSFPLNYDQQQLSDSSNSIAELRIRID